MTAPLLEIAHLDVSYTGTPVLRDISCTVPEGEIVALVGANGAGKTTLLRAISGLLVPDRGDIRFRGEPIAGLDAADIVRRGIAQVPEGRRLFAGMTIQENLLMGAYTRRDATEIQAGLERVYAIFPRLRERRHQLAGKLSGGEQQMCAIGRALMTHPTVLLVDELSLGLAPLVVDALTEVLQQIHESGVTVVLVEQDIYMALGLAQHAYVLDTGRLVRSGLAEDLLRDESIVKTYLGGAGLSEDGLGVTVDA